MTNTRGSDLGEPSVALIRVISDGGGGYLLVDELRSPVLLDANAFLSALQARGLAPTTIRAYAFERLRISKGRFRVAGSWRDAVERSAEHV